jgi:26S proteasome regulatory subunit N5
MVRLCRDLGNWSKLSSTLQVINKRRAQSKLAISAIVEEAIAYIDTCSVKADKIELIKTLRDITEGKMYVEAECARMHLKLAHIYESDGDIEAACTEIQDVHVETYGSLPKKEKAEYIIEQIRVNMVRKDYIRALIQSRKMNEKLLQGDDFNEIRLKFYTLMVDYFTYEKNAWEISQAYYKVFSFIHR